VKGDIGRISAELQQFLDNRTARVNANGCQLSFLNQYLINMV
jgi:hypothetical protein